MIIHLFLRQLAFFELHYLGDLQSKSVYAYQYLPNATINQNNYLSPNR